MNTPKVSHEFTTNPSTLSCAFLSTLDRSVGIQDSQMRLGGETFVLNEGMAYLLVRPGKPELHFTVPVRQRVLPVNHDVVESP